MSERPGCIPGLLIALKESLVRFREHMQEGQAEAEKLPYDKHRLLSQDELSFYSVLKEAVGQDAHICPKVRLGDLVHTTHRGKGRMAHVNRVNRKHVDFVLVDPETMLTLVVLELDDSSHQRDDRKARDEFVDKVFEAAGIPLVHIDSNWRGYAVDELRGRLAPHIGLPVQVQATGPDADVTSEPISDDPVQAVKTPVCPKCDVPMVERTARRGKNAGNQFFGCPNYPRCREVC